MDMQKKNFLLVEHGGERKQFTLEILLADTTLAVYVAASTVPSWLSDLIPRERIIQTDTYSSVKLLADVVAFIESRDITLHGMGTFVEHTVTQTADVADALGLIGISPGAARRSSSNKLLMRRTCQGGGVPTPRFHVLPQLSRDELIRGIAKVGTPCVIKPIFGWMSFGVIKIETGYDVDAIMSEISGNTREGKEEAFKNFQGTYIIEQYLSGPMVSVDGIVAGGEVHIAGIVEFIMGPEPRFTQEANYIPARLDDGTATAAKNMAISILKTLGFDNTGFHCEMRLTPEGPVLIEVAARLPGGPLQPGHLKSSGVNLTRELINVWLGRPYDMDAKQTVHILQKAVFPRRSGVIKQISKEGGVESHPNVWELSIIVSEGERVVTYPDIPKPFYYYAIYAETEDALRALSEEVEAKILFEIE